MELAPMFVEQRWNILQQLSKKSLSPLQLAGMTKTTIANMSQQLRLLEAANLVKKERVPNRDKGQPRTLFSLNDDYAYIVSLMDEFAEKKLIKLSGSQKNLMKILSIEDDELREKIQDIYFSLYGYFGKIDSFAMDLSSKPSILVVCSDAETRKKIEKTDGVKIVTEQKMKEQVKNNGGRAVQLDTPRPVLKG
ncbi:winged helix-turn-helix transcriptional regulator [Candidatus Woesearchaeota archaeon]|nr:winged helix-turn-helix transcriptional regulator [Candidatus Woesearchaeota archaeon]